MINFQKRLLKVVKLFKKINAHNNRPIEIFVNKILHLKPRSNKKQVVKKQINSQNEVTQMK